MTFSVSSFLLLLIAVSGDTFMVGLSYGATHVKVPRLSMLLIAFISGLMLTFSIKTGSVFSALSSAYPIKILSFVLLFMLALYKGYDALSSHKKGYYYFTTNAFSEKVNQHEKQILSPKEACLLAVLLSLDSLAAGFSTPALNLPPVILFFCSAFVHFLALRFGLMSAKLLSPKTSSFLPFLAPAILLFLAVLRLLGI